MTAPSPTPPGAHDAATAIAALGRIDGLDTARGLQFFAGRHGLYLRSLRQFVELYGQHIDSVDALLAGAPGASADAVRRDVHDVGGVGASLGAVRLELLARQFEALQRESAPAAAWRPLLVAWREALTRLLRELGEQLPPD